MIGNNYSTSPMKLYLLKNVCTLSTFKNYLFFLFTATYAFKINKITKRL